MTALRIAQYLNIAGARLRRRHIPIGGKGFQEGWENFNGVKYFLFDQSPVKTVWENGIIVEIYSIDPGTASEYRNDRLAFYIETQASDQHEISEADYRSRVHEIYLALPEDIKISQAIDQQKDMLNKLK